MERGLQTCVCPDQTHSSLSTENSGHLCFLFYTFLHIGVLETTKKSELFFSFLNSSPKISESESRKELPASLPLILFIAVVPSVRPRAKSAQVGFSSLQPPVAVESALPHPARGPLASPNVASTLTRPTVKAECPPCTSPTAVFCLLFSGCSIRLYDPLPFPVQATTCLFSL